MRAAATAAVQIWAHACKNGQNGKEIKHHLVCFFLDRLAFLRHIKVVTFQADRLASERPVVTRNCRNRSEI